MISIIFNLKNSNQPIVFDNFDSSSVSVSFREQGLMCDEMSISKSAAAGLALRDGWNKIKYLKDEISNIEVQYDNNVIYNHENLEDISYSITFSDGNVLEVLSFIFKR